MGMADDEEAAALELKKKRTFRKFTYRGIDLDNLLDLTPEQLIDLVHARARRRMNRGIKKKGNALMKKLRKAKKDCGPYDKPDVVKTHLREFSITYKPVRHGRPGIGATSSSKFIPLK